jgi:signal transduction histidine kinase
MACGLVRIDRSELKAWTSNPAYVLKVMTLQGSDGVISHSLTTAASAVGHVPGPSLAPDGKLWFSAIDDASFIDPRHIPVNNSPPSVHIEQITADQKVRWQKVWSNADSKIHLLPRSHDIQIDYTALSLVASEKNRFKCKLEGYDNDWIDVGNRRQAFYTNLPPRRYRFRVIASNNSGVWNDGGDTIEFFIDPMYYQTNWFLALMAAAGLAMLWGLYRLRLYQISREFNAQLDGRVEERLHVARELHDTLLQSFHGLLPRLQAAYNLLPGRVADAKQVLEDALDDAGKAITEARDAVQGMRSSTAVINDLPKALEVFGEELAAQHAAANEAATNGNAANFSAEVEGTPQDLHPILRDEIYRIAAEALRNAFHHAGARRIEVEIRYGPRDFRVRVRDDGAGIDPAILGQEGRSGHFGLKGMRERAQHIGGKLEVWSQRDAGTEIELTIPASVAYGRKGDRRSRMS